MNDWKLFVMKTHNFRGVFSWTATKGRLCLEVCGIIFVSIVLSTISQVSNNCYTYNSLTPKNDHRSNLITKQHPIWLNTLHFHFTEQDFSFALFVFGYTPTFSICSAMFSSYGVEWHINGQEVQQVPILYIILHKCYNMRGISCIE